MEGITMWYWLVWAKSGCEWRYLGHKVVGSLEHESLCLTILLLGGEYSQELYWSGE